MTATDHLAEAIADAVVQKLSAAAPPPAATHAELGDMLYPVPLICQQLGTRGRPMAYQTFQKHYLETRLLTLIHNPLDRRTRYVRLSDWLKLKKER